MPGNCTTQDGMEPDRGHQMVLCLIVCVSDSNPATERDPLSAPPRCFPWLLCPSSDDSPRPGICVVPGDDLWGRSVHRKGGRVWHGCPPRCSPWNASLSPGAAGWSVAGAGEVPTVPAAWDSLSPSHPLAGAPVGVAGQPPGRVHSRAGLCAAWHRRVGKRQERLPTARGLIGLSIGPGNKPVRS